MLDKRPLRAIVVLLLAFFVGSCSRHKPMVIETPSFQEWLSSNSTPRIIAILPFSNETKVEGVHELVRESFYEYFSAKSFYDIELREIDAVIKAVEEAQGKNFHACSPQELGKLLRCDALVYGRVTRLNRFFMLIYSQMTLETEIRIIETQSGREIWRHFLRKRFHEGGVPTSPFGVIPTAIRTSYSLRKGRRNKDIDAFCKDFVSRIPETQIPIAADLDELCELQVASFKLEEGAQSIASRLSQHGYKPSVREVQKDGETWYRVSIGPFISREEAVNYQAKLKQEFTFTNPIVVKNETSDTTPIKKDSVELCEIEVASFKLKEGAQSIAARLSQRGYKPFLTIANNHGELWYNVMVGPYTSKEEALRSSEKLKREFDFLNPVVVKSEHSTLLPTKVDTIN